MKKGEKMSQEQKDKIAASERRKYVSADTCLRIKVAKMGCTRAPHSAATKEKLRLQKLGPKNHRYGVALTEEAKKQLQLNWTAENNPRWKGGITPINQQIRTSREYSLWRQAVLKRDRYTCVIGGPSHGKKFHVDHIKRFADYPELRLEVSNGRTLCIDCHKKTETWGAKKQYAEKI